MNIVRDERGQITALVDEDGSPVRQILRDERGVAVGIRDMKSAEATIEKATADLERLVRQEVRSAVDELSEQLAKATGATTRQGAGVHGAVSRAVEHREARDAAGRWSSTRCGSKRRRGGLVGRSR